VELPAIDLDHDSLAAPQEIDLVVLVAEEDVTIDLGLGEAGPRAEVAKAPFEAAGRDVLAEIATGEYGAELRMPGLRWLRERSSLIVLRSKSPSRTACSHARSSWGRVAKVARSSRVRGTEVTGMPWISVTSVALSSGRLWT
jgi:hypothetical protein